MSHIDALKWEEFRKDPQEHFERTKIVNFVIIHVQVRGEPVDKVSEKSFKSACKTDLQSYKDKDAIVSSASVQNVKTCT